MRLDKYLKVSRLIIRRTVAKEMCSAGRVKVNGKVAKPGTEVEVGDVLEIGFGNGSTKVKIKEIRPNARKDEASQLYEYLSAGGGSGNAE